MKIGFVFNLLGFIALAAGCAVSSEAPVAAKPELPESWNVSIGDETGCPDITGVFALTPTVATLQQNGLWEVAKGNWYDFALLFPFDRGDGDDQITSNNSGRYSSNSFEIESAKQDGTIQIISPVKNTKNYVLHTLEKSEGDYKCKAGSIVFPEFRIRGGTEGAVLDGGVYRSATITLSNDLLVYELTQGQETSHKYFLFEKVMRAPSTK